MRYEIEINGPFRNFELVGTVAHRIPSVGWMDLYQVCEATPLMGSGSSFDIKSDLNRFYYSSFDNRGELVLLKEIVDSTEVENPVSRGVRSGLYWVEKLAFDQMRKTIREEVILADLPIAPPNQVQELSGWVYFVRRPCGKGYVYGDKLVGTIERANSLGVEYFAGLDFEILGAEVCMTISAKDKAPAALSSIFSKERVIKGLNKEA